MEANPKNKVLKGYIFRKAEVATVPKREAAIKCSYCDKQSVRLLLCLGLL
jgi:hypothetical protein